MGKPAHTLEQVKHQLYNQTQALYKSRKLARNWKKKCLEAQETLKEYVFIDKKPDYFLGMAGAAICRHYYRSHGLNNRQMELLIIISYVGVFFQYQHKLFRKTDINPDERLPELIKERLVVKVEAPALRSYKPRAGYALTQRGKDLVADYEKYFDKKIQEIRENKLTPFILEDGAYFRKRYRTRHERRLAQGGGMLKRTKVSEMFVPINNEAETDTAE